MSKYIYKYLTSIQYHILYACTIDVDAGLQSKLIFQFQLFYRYHPAESNKNIQKWHLECQQHDDLEPLSFNSLELHAAEKGAAHDLGPLRTAKQEEAAAGQFS